MPGKKEITTNLLWYPGHELLIKDIVRAENCFLFDSLGKRYLDLEAGVWCTALGHCNPRITKAMFEQAALLYHTGFVYSSEIVEQAARAVLSLIGFAGGKCVFLCSGSEAVEYGVRVAQSIIAAPLLMTMTDSYFGAYGSASKKNQSEWFCFDWQPCSACPYPGECSKSCEYWAAIPYSLIGGFLFEPGSSSGLVRFPPKKPIRNIVDTIKKKGGLVLVNEVTTGVGRTGMWFGFQHYGIHPDIVAVGKSIGNGYPVSAAVFSPAVIDRPGGVPIKYAQSHQNDPLGAAVVREVTRIIKQENLIEKGKNTAAVLVRGLETIKSRTDRIKEIRSRGLMIAIELLDDAQNSFTIQTHRELVRRGFIVGRRPDVRVLRLDPALTIDSVDIEDFLSTFEAVLAEQSQGKRQRNS
ncbi:MAG: aminotransferase class III-fold pyridoxal phosphate-dependent enzyme [Candidatus Aminicenantes bacterium]|nr:aminotransferase class III-fold pyridoxal phosphate-dependent enzyme [Candidatus Aminicenantes bacterium]